MQAGVQYGGVFPLEQPDPPDLVGQANPRARYRFRDDFGSMLFMTRIDGRKDRRDGYAVDTGVPDFMSGFAPFKLTSCTFPNVGTSTPSVSMTNNSALPSPSTSATP